MHILTPEMYILASNGQKFTFRKGTAPVTAFVPSVCFYPKSRLLFFWVQDSLSTAYWLPTKIHFGLPL